MRGGRRGPAPVAHVVNEYGHTSETFIRDSIEELERAGWEAWVFSQRVLNREACPHPPEERTIEAGAGLDGLAGLGRLLGRPPERRFAAAVEGAAARAGVAVVHAHFGWAAPFAQELARRVGAPLFVSFYGSDATVFPRARRGRRLRAAARRRPTHAYEELIGKADRVIAVSEFMAAKLRDLGFGSEIAVVPIGVRLERFPFRPPRPSGEETRLLFVGRLVPRKGLDLLLRALERVATEQPEVTLDVVGDGPSRAELEGLAERLGLARRVRFLGAQWPDGVLRAQREADLQVVPSRTMPSGEAEGSPTVTKEAQAVGLQLVATASGGTVETIAPPYRGELVPENDAEALADRILAVLDDRPAWPQRARCGRQWVEEQFDWRRLAPRIGGLYGEALEQDTVRLRSRSIE